MTGVPEGRAAASSKRRGPPLETTSENRVEVLRARDWSSAYRLIGGILGEIPAYRWILGDHVEDPEAGTLLAALAVGPIARAGGLLGIRDDDRVVAALAWHDPGAADVDTDAEALTGDVHALAARPDMARRLLDFWSSDLMRPPAPDAVNIAIAVTDPDRRQAGMLHALVEPVAAYCVAHHLPFYAWTALPVLRDVYRDSFGLTQYATERFDGATLYGMTTARPPLPIPSR